MANILKLNNLLIRQLKTDCLSLYSYMLHSSDSKAFLDPLRDVDAYTAFDKELPGKTKYIFETHYHADYVSGFVDLARKTGGQIVFGPESNPLFNCLAVKHNQVLPFGDYQIRALHTPGHTFESTCYLLEKDGKHEAVFTGDTLFLGDVGRPDLAQTTTVTSKDMAKKLFDSLKILKELQGSCLVLPTHGAGSACGKNISPGLFCNIETQLKTNHAFAEKNQDNFIKMVLSGLPAAPSYFFMDVGLNKKGDLQSAEDILSKAKKMTADEIFAASKQEKTYLFDCRKASEYSKGHLPNSIFLPTEGQLAVYAAYLADPTKGDKILLVAPTGKHHELILRFARTGLDSVVGYIEDSDLANCKTPLEAITELEFSDGADFDNKVADGTVLDIRQPSEWDHTGVYKDAQLAALSEIKGIALSTPAEEKKEKFYVHCRSGVRSLMGIGFLRVLGFTNLVNVPGGFDKMNKLGVEITSELPEALKAL